MSDRLIKCGNETISKYEIEAFKIDTDSCRLNYSCPVELRVLSLINAAGKTIKLHLSNFNHYDNSLLLSKRSRNLCKGVRFINIGLTDSLDFIELKDSENKNRSDIWDNIQTLNAKNKLIGYPSLCMVNNKKYLEIPDDIISLRIVKPVEGIIVRNELESKNIESIIIDSDIDIPQYGFALSHLKSIKFNGKVEHIHSYAFYKTRLQSIKLPRTLKKLDRLSFSNNAKLEIVDMSECENLSSIEDNIFLDCWSLQTIYVHPNIDIRLILNFGIVDKDIHIIHGTTHYKLVTNFISKDIMSRHKIAQLYDACNKLILSEVL